MSWAQKRIRGVLLDITGVLYNGSSEGGVAIEGSVDAVRRLSEAGVPVRLCSNETSITRQGLVDKLNSFGFSINLEHLFSPAPAVKRVIAERGLRPYIVVAKDAVGEYDSQEEPFDSVVLTDAQEAFSYENMNKALKVLQASPKPVLIALGKGRYYLDKGEMALDVGAYAKALEYATGLQAEVVGKPAPTFFNAALADMGVAADDAVMVGDDLENDVGGSQACGIRGVQVRTGKYMPKDEENKKVTPDGRVANLAEAVDVILEQWKNY